MIVLAATFLALSAGGAAAFPQQHQPIVSIGGAVATPASYSEPARGASTAYAHDLFGQPALVVRIAHRNRPGRVA